MDRRGPTLALLMKHGREHSRLSVLFREIVAARFGISAADAECVDFLLEAGSATAGDLARLTGLTTGAITGVIRRLKAAGLVTATRDPRDRRRVVVRLVAKTFKKGFALYTSYATAANAHVYSRYSLRQLETLADYHR